VAGCAAVEAGLERVHGVVARREVWVCVVPALIVVELDVLVSVLDSLYFLCRTRCGYMSLSIFTLDFFRLVQGSLTEGEGSVRLTSFYRLVWINGSLHLN